MTVTVARSLWSVLMVLCPAVAWAAPPTVSTEPAVRTSPFGVTLEGLVNPNLTEATGWFRYSTVDPGTCNDTFGTRAPTASGVALGAGSSPVRLTQAVSSLPLATTYYACALASNDDGTSMGTVQSFTTDTAAPPNLSPPTLAHITSLSATVSTTVNPNGAATTAWVWYAPEASAEPTCSAAFGTTATTTASVSVGSGYGAQPASTTVSGLLPATRYAVCAVAENDQGQAFSSRVWFTTPLPPTVNTDHVTDVTRSTATLNATAIANHAATIGWFRYGTTHPGLCTDDFGIRAPASGGLPAGNSTQAIPFSQSVDLGSAGTPYYACAFVSSSAGTGAGIVRSFVTTDLPEVTTLDPSMVSTTGFTLNGLVNPNGAPTHSYFRYDTTPATTCSDAFGSRTPGTASNVIGSGTTPVAVSERVGSPDHGATYYVCAVAESAEGVAYGDVVAFSAPPAAPHTQTDAPLLLADGSVRLLGTTDPNGSPTSGWFRYAATPLPCVEGAGTRVPASGNLPVASTKSVTTFSYDLAGLDPNAAYHVCAFSENAVGLSAGVAVPFSTARAPSTATSNVTGLGPTQATLNGLAKPSGLASTGWFRYSLTDPQVCNDTFGTRVPTSGGLNLGASPSWLVPYDVAASGLEERSTYYVCAIASNALGVAVGEVVAFTTTGAPLVVTLPPSEVSPSEAALDAKVRAGGAGATVWFRYAAAPQASCDDTFGTRVPSTGGVAVSPSGTEQGVRQLATGLASGVDYQVCAIASNALGTAFGEIATFRLDANQPIVTTEPPSSVASTSATLAATVNPNGQPATAWFQYSTDNPGSCYDGFGTRAPESGGVDAGDGTGPVPITFPAADLLPNTDYYGCVVAENASGTVVGNVVAFRTLGPPTVQTLDVAVVGDDAAQLDAEVVANGLATVGWFRASTTHPGTCNDTFGTRIPEVDGQDLGSDFGVELLRTIWGGAQPNTTYYFCGLASNAAGLGWGEVKSFTTAGPPVIAEFWAVPRSSTSVELWASVDQAGSYTNLWFRYSLTNPGVCNSTFGDRFPTFQGFTFSGDRVDTIVAIMSELLPGNTYYLCAVAANSYGSTVGEEVAVVQTAEALPTVVTRPALDVVGTSATLRAQGTAVNTATSGWFRVAEGRWYACDDAYGTRVPGEGEIDLGDTASPVSFEQRIEGLTPGTRHSVCAFMSSAAGTVSGGVRLFTTSAKPVVTTEAAPAVGAATLTLNGSAQPMESETTGFFRFGTEPGVCGEGLGARVPAEGGVSLGSGSSAVSYAQALTGLEPDTTYWYCAAAESEAGTSYGELQAVRTVGAPTVSTLAPAAVQPTSATLSGSANPTGALTAGWVRYDTTDPGLCNNTFGTQAPVGGGNGLGNGREDVLFSVDVTGLAPATTYWACALASNDYGTALGAVVSFTTPPLGPVITTAAASGVDATSATLHGAATPGGTDTTGWFRYGTTDPVTCNDAFGTRTPATGGTSLGQGSTPVAYSEALTSLEPGTTYFACAIAENAGGFGFGDVVVFTTLRAPEVTTLPTNDLTARSAFLSATANPFGNTATGWFRVGTAPPTTCDDTYGTRAPATGSATLGNGWEPVPFMHLADGLSPNTTYHFCALAQNALGTSSGGFQSFKTPTDRPDVTTTGAAYVDRFTANVAGQVVPNGSPTTVWTRYSEVDPGTCTDTFGQRTPAAGGTAVGSGNGSVPVTLRVDALTVGQTYHYCLIADNTRGTTYGTLRTYVHEATPTVRTGEPSPITGSSATLVGEATPNGTPAVGWFRYSTSSPGTCNDSFGTRSPATGGTNLGSDFAPVPYTVDGVGLQPATRYYVCALAENTVGLNVGEPVSFITPAPPLVVTAPITDLAAREATLTGRVTPRGAVTTARFRTSTSHPGTCDDSFGSVVGEQLVGSGDAEIPFTHVLTGLLPGTTYHTCAIAQNSEGTAFGAVISFVTPSLPVAVTEAPTSVAPSTATLRGSATPNGSLTMGWFRYTTEVRSTCDDTFGTATDPWPLGSGSSPMPYADVLTGLAPGTTFTYCAIAESSAGKAYGSMVSFTTPGTPIVTTVDAAPVLRNAATLQGVANPRAGTTVGWFRYDTTDPGSCSDSFGTRVPGSDGLTLGSGQAYVPFEADLSALAAGTTYWFCALASNEAGLGMGEVLSFSTPGGPIVETRPVADLTTTGVTLQGRGTPQGLASTAWFRLGTEDPSPCDDSFGTRWPATGGTDLGSGASPVDFNEAVSGLVPGTTYHACAVGQDAAGISYGAVVSFTTPRAPDVSTLAATQVDATRATLNGEATPHGELTTGWFRYDTTDPVVCNDTFGTATDPWPLGSGSSPMPFENTFELLDPDTTYHFCALARNTGGLVVGAVLSFRTEPLLGTEAPAVSTLAASDITVGGAVLHGAANPLGSATTGWFRYASVPPATCDDSFGIRAPASGGTALGAGVAAVGFAEVLTGLPSDTTFWACALAQNTHGLTTGALVSFRTDSVVAVPEVVTVAGTALSSTSILLEGLANPRGGGASGWFRYDTTDPGTCSDTFGIRFPATGGSFLGAGSTDVAFSETLAGLAPGTTVHFCALANNAAGMAWGDVIAVTTPAAPEVATLDATSVNTARATLQATVDPNLADTGAWFRYDTVHPGACNDAFGTRAPGTAEIGVGADTSPVPVSQPIVGLSPGTTYFVCVIAVNTAGTSFGEVVPFTTTPDVPYVVTDAVTDVDLTSATLHGTGTPNGATTDAWFRYGTTDPGACNDVFGTRAPATGTLPLGAGVVGVPFTSAVAGLTTAQTYFVCALAENSFGKAYGEVVSFTVGIDPPEVVTEAPEAVTDRLATLVGTASPRGSEAVGWFRLGDPGAGTCDDAFGIRVPATGGIALGAGLDDVSFELDATGLDPARTYAACAAASNAGGASFGEPVSFTTDAAVPVVTTRPAEVEASGSVLLVGGANPLGSATDAWFRISQKDPGGCDAIFGRRVPDTGATKVGAGRTDTPFTETVDELAPGTWFVCAVAANEAGAAFGEVVTFVVPEVDDDDDDDDTDPSCGCAVPSGGAGPGSLWPLAFVATMAGRRRRSSAA